MLSRPRRHLSYANVMSTIAVFLALGGGAAYAASHYLITSTKQIKPSVLATLKGRPGAAGVSGAPGERGPAGPAGANGAAGANGTGATGVEGKQGKEGVEGREGPPGPTEFKALPPEQTETGTWSFNGEGVVEGTEKYQFVAISFPIPLSHVLTEAHAHAIEAGKPAPSGCGDGTVETPKAEPGNLCVYFKSQLAGLGTLAATPFQAPETLEGTLLAGVGRTGTMMLVEGLEPESAAYGTWAVTAPEE